MSSETGIYVYGFGRAADTGRVSTEDQPDVYLIDTGELVAYARIVDLAEYSEEALKARGDDHAWLVAEAQKHHKVVAAIHHQVPILPAKFGSAYPTNEDIREALASLEQAMLDRLNMLEGCDEWAAHVYLESGDLTQVVVERDPELKQLAAELETASEGRKYMLRQRVQARIQEAIERYEAELADTALNALRTLAIEFQLEPPRDPEAVPEGETEAARASLLVRREQAEAFIELAERTNEELDQIWLQITGPWPAYSFAQFATEDEVVRYG